MARKKRPLLTVFIILVLVGLFLGTSSIVVLKYLTPSKRLAFGEKIAIIPIEGPITTPDEIIDQLVRFREDRSIKAIILRINSPGGGVGPSQEIYREIRKTIDKKKVIASLGSVAASGGYYIAAAANKIVANPGTLTGSIGVIMQFVGLQELLQKIGVKMEVVKSGEFKDIGSPHRPLTKREKALLQELITSIQDQFVKAVAEARGLSEQRVRKIADGRILSGAQAKELGLVDELGNFRDAVELAKQMAGLKGKVSLVYPRKKEIKFWDILFQGMVKGAEKVLSRSSARLQYLWSPASSGLSENN